MRTLLLALAALPLSACHASWDNDHANKQGPGQASADAIPPSGSGGSRSFDAKDFTEVELFGPDDIEVKYGTAFSVRADGDPKVLDELDITVRGGKLRVGRKSQGWGWHSSSDGGVKVQVTLPRLTAASVTGSGDLTADKGEGDFEAELTGSGNLTIAALTGGSVEFKVVGSGDLKAAGTANRLDGEIMGSGDIDARGLTATGAKISIMGSGNVYGTVKGDANVSIMGSGDAELTGGAKCKISAMGSGEAKCS
ncbi:DUF2807 domain-containing protein [Sphingomonas sp. AOB5]|uniref:head GIN domain-containing protein n=1 Tax=Sphingomonas sp. AOB5 TaxID=3034017 RepID=UPI0023F72427|nr:head GIN domain-containing protein [Sphingomonas sp. AOB5]MDF7777908.1 DUF2807 domain-containing protein [Sphingomonas sp. AOB5]